MTDQLLICPEHNARAQFRETSAHVYRGRDFGPIWECPVPTCDRYVGCHPNGSPKGRLADKALRLAKIKAHAAFDPLWRGLDAQRLAYPEEAGPHRKLANAMRGRAYAWLAIHMGLSDAETHIGMFDEAQCALVIEIINREKPTAATVRAWWKETGKVKGTK